MPASPGEYPIASHSSMAFTQKALASDRSPRCTLFQADPFSALARTSLMFRSPGAASDSRSASPMTARASACRPWRSSICEEGRVGPGEPEVVAERQ